MESYKQQCFLEDMDCKACEHGFVVNPYDEGKVIGGRQCTILLRKDEIKVSHVDSQVVSEVLGELEKEYGKGALWQKAQLPGNGA